MSPLANGEAHNVDLLGQEEEELTLSSGKKRRVKVVQQESEFFKMFFGRRKELIVYGNRGQAQRVSETLNVFSPIILDLEQRDLYSSWESQREFVIDDFKEESSG